MSSVLVGARLALALGEGRGRGKPCPYRSVVSFRQKAQEGLVAQHDRLVAQAQTAIDQLCEAEAQGLFQRHAKNVGESNAVAALKGRDVQALTQSQGENDGLGHLPGAVARVSEG